MRLAVSDIATLRGLQLEKRVRLTTHVGAQAFLHVDNDPDALVTELLRLARLGALLEAENLESPASPVRVVITRAKAPDQQPYRERVG